MWVDRGSSDLFLGRPLDCSHRSRCADKTNGLITRTDVQKKHSTVSALCREERVHKAVGYLASERIILVLVLTPHASTSPAELTARLDTAVE